MTKYTSNEQYERDKAAAIRRLKLFDFEVTINLLKQSKWIGADNQQDSGYHKPYSLLKYFPDDFLTIIDEKVSTIPI